VKAGEQAPADAILPTDAELNMMAQNYFKQQGSGDQLGTSSRAAEQQAWDLAFENGYTDGFRKTHGRRTECCRQVPVEAFALSALGAAFSALRFNHKGF